jgi:Methylamine utilisation protein MauE
MDPAHLAVGAMSLAVAATFVVAAAGKLSASTQFAESLVRFGITRIPRPWAARGVAMFELVVAVALWVPLLRTGAAAVAATAFALFARLVARRLRAGERFPCHCFGSSKRDIDAFALIRALAFAALSLALLGALVGGAEAPTRLSEVAVSAAVASAVGVVAALLVQALRLLQFDQSWANGFRAMGRAATEQEGRS